MFNKTINKFLISVNKFLIYIIKKYGSFVITIFIAMGILLGIKKIFSGNIIENYDEDEDEDEDGDNEDNNEFNDRSDELHMLDALSKSSEPWDRALSTTLGLVPNTMLAATDATTRFFEVVM